MSPRKFIIDKNDCSLLLIDVQERLFNAMDVEVRIKILKNTQMLIDSARVFGVPIIVTEQYPKGIGRTLPVVMAKLPDVTPIEKLHFNCLKEEPIASQIDGSSRNTVIICGMETHICVLNTALHLMEEGKNVVVVSDAVCSRRKHDWRTALDALTAAGAVVYPAESVSFMFLEKAGTEEFKTLSPLFR